MMRRAARNPLLWWGPWLVVLAGGSALIAFLWHSDANEADRIALVAVAMSVVGVVIATVGVKWTRDAVVIADRSMRAEVLYEEMQRLERLGGAIRVCANLTSPKESASRLEEALGPFTETELPKSFELQQSCRSGSLPDSSLIVRANQEVADALDAKRAARASLTAP